MQQAAGTDRIALNGVALPTLQIRNASPSIHSPSSASLHSNCFRLRLRARAERRFVRGLAHASTRTPAWRQPSEI